MNPSVRGKQSPVLTVAVAKVQSFFIGVFGFAVATKPTNSNRERSREVPHLPTKTSSGPD